jgi:predicted nucleic acid-binding protein
VPNNYILDTCTFNDLLDGKFHLANISSDGRFLATHIQRDELMATLDEARRNRLASKFEEVNPVFVPTETFCCDVSRLDGWAKWGAGYLFGELRTFLDARKKRRNNTQDALIAEVAIANGFTLVTSDADLADAATKYGARVRDPRLSRPSAQPADSRPSGS